MPPLQVAHLAPLLPLWIAADPSHVQVSVTEPWVSGVAPGQKTAGAFMTLTSKIDVDGGLALPVGKR